MTKSSGSEGSLVALGRLAERVLSLVVAALMATLMLFTFYDVTARYAFNSPVLGGSEIMEFIMGTLIFATLPLISRTNDHISVSLLDHLFKGPVRRIQQIFISVFSAVVVGFLAWRLFVTADEMRETGLLAIFLEMEIAPVVYGMAALAWVAFFVILLLLVSQLAGRQDDDEESSSIDL